MEAPFLKEIQLTVGRLVNRILRIGGIIVAVFVVQVPIAGPSIGLGYDVIMQVEDMLHQAAKASPQWDSRQDAIRRDVHDITFSLDQAWKTAEHSRHAERQDYAEQALLILQRATARGYFDRTKTEPVLALIRGLLSNRAG